MKDWQKTLLEPAAHTTLKQLDLPKTKEQLIESTGIEEQRMQKLLDQLEQQNLLTQEITSGIRKYRLNNTQDRIKQLRLEIEEHTTLEIENNVKARNYHKARKQIHRNPPVENIQTRRTIAKIEALQKLEELPQTRLKSQVDGPWQSLKGFIPRF